MSMEMSPRSPEYGSPNGFTPYDPEYPRMSWPAYGVPDARQAPFQLPIAPEFVVDEEEELSDERLMPGSALARGIGDVAIEGVRSLGNEVGDTTLRLLGAVGVAPLDPQLPASYAYSPRALAA